MSQPGSAASQPTPRSGDRRLAPAIGSGDLTQRIEAKTKDGEKLKGFHLDLSFERMSA